jgi:hypothetical protein
VDELGTNNGPKDTERAEIREINGGFFVDIPHVNLDPSKAPLEFSVTLSKESTRLPEMPQIEDELSAVREMLGEARELRSLPEEERPRQLMEILRSRVQYSYADTLAELDSSDTERAQAIRANNGLPLLQLSSLRNAVKLGYANCMPLTAGMLTLGREAGLDGAFLGNGLDEGPNPLKNIRRSDTQQLLFRGDSNEGAHIPAVHAWAEFKMSNGVWLPVDPSTELVGDNDTEMQIFRDADYHAAVGRSLKTELTEGVRRLSTRGLEFLPGEASHTGKLGVTVDAHAGDPYNGPFHMRFGVYRPPVGVALEVPFKIASVKL